MHTRSFLAAVILTAFALAGGGHHNAMASDDASSKADVAQLGMEQLRSRLSLTPDQEAKIKPLVEARNQKLKTLRGSMEASASRREKRGALKEVRSIQSEFVEKVEPLLSKEQQKEWAALREEMRDEMVKRYRNR